MVKKNGALYMTVGTCHLIIVATNENHSQTLEARP